ncbi:MAG TPA: acyl-CoA dehydrogenase family protein [Acidimicrobiales bacterium]|nr:acyl-CoA dehydrogenase family protein [Acidimicrobiales bacterium]
MSFEPSPRGADLRLRVSEFIESVVLPAEPVYEEQMRAAGDPHAHPGVIEELKAEAKERGLWNLFMPHATPWTPDPVPNLDYAYLAELAGRSHLASEAMNCSAPDTGNMEVLALFGSDRQKDEWLVPLLEGRIRSAFAMTEPDVASSDATNIQLSIVRDGDDYVLNGRKWWISGAASERCAVFIVMGKTDPSAARHQQQSMILVPRGTPGLTIVRNLPVFGYTDREGHCELRFEDVRVPASNLVAEEGMGFAIAQARLGPGRIHHCMRCIGMAERALELMCRRVLGREAFGKPLAAQGVIREWIADSRIEIEQARLLTLKAAHLMDTVGHKGAATEISAIKVVAPNMALRVVDRAIQAHGGGGVSDDFPLARMYAGLRTLRFADGPDEVHRRQLARAELGRYA